MHKLAQSAIINTTEDTRVQLVQDSTNLSYRFVKTAAGGVCLLGPIPYGKTVRCIKVVAQNEFKNTVLIGGATVEVVAASTRYALNIWNPEADYEGHSQGPLTYAYTSAAALSGDAFTDRLNVYTALVNKINAYAGNNCTAYLLAKVPYTLGTSTGDAATNFIVGENVTQATSGITAQVAACSIATGAFASDDATGTLWLYNLSNAAAYDAGTKTWSADGTTAAVTGITRGNTNCIVTGTAASHKLGQGIVIVDDAGYFTSNKWRGGINNVGLIAGFSTATATVIEAGKYAIGVGTDMLARRPVFDQTHQQVIAGDIELAFSNDELPVAGTYYKKYIFEVRDGDENAIDAAKVESLKHYVIYIAQTDANHIGDLDTAIDAAILL